MKRKHGIIANSVQSKLPWCKLLLLLLFCLCCCCCCCTAGGAIACHNLSNKPQPTKRQNSPRTSSKMNYRTDRRKSRRRYSACMYHPCSFEGRDSGHKPRLIVQSFPGLALTFIVYHNVAITVMLVLVSTQALKHIVPCRLIFLASA